MLDIIESIKDVPRYSANGDKTDEILQDHDRNIKNIKDKFAEELKEIQSRISVITSSDLGIQGNLSDLSKVLKDMANNSHLGLSNKEQLIFKKLSVEIRNISYKINKEPDKAQNYLKQCSNILNQFCNTPETKHSQNQAVTSIAKDLSKVSEALLKVPPLPCPKEEQNISKFKDMKNTMAQNRASVLSPTNRGAGTENPSKPPANKDKTILCRFSKADRNKIKKFTENIDFSTLEGKKESIQNLETILKQLTQETSHENNIELTVFKEMHQNLSSLTELNTQNVKLELLEKKIDSILKSPQLIEINGENTGDTPDTEIVNTPTFK